MTDRSLLTWLIATLVVTGCVPSEPTPEPSALRAAPFIAASQGVAVYGDGADDWFGRATTTGDWNGDGFDDFAVGAHLDDNAGANSGSVFVFLGSSGGPTGGVGSAVAHTVLTGDSDGDVLGEALSGAGDVNGDGFDDLIVASRLDNNIGSVFVFHGSAGGLPSGQASSVADAVLSGDDLYDIFGNSVSAAGDLNGDGFDDLAVGCELDDTNGYYSGSVFVWHGSASGITAGAASATADVLLVGDNVQDQFGSTVSIAGDLDGDGFDELVVASPFHPINGMNSGLAWVFHGSASGVSPGVAGSVADAVLSGPTYSLFGEAVSGAGDVNNDGFGDLAIGGTHFSLSPPGDGAALVFLGSSAGIASGDALTVADALLTADDNNEGFGSHLAGPGDLDGDGFDDLVVGAFRDADNGVFSGSTYVFLGSATGVASGVGSQVADVSFSGDAPGDHFAVVSGGDVNGDAQPDLVVGAYRDDDSGPDSGSAFVFLSGIDFLQATPAPTVFAGASQSADEGSAVAFVASSGDFASPPTYSWDFGDGGTATGPNPSHVYVDDGTYTVTLTGSNSTGESATNTTLAIIANVPPQIIVSTPPPATEGSTWTYGPGASDPAGTADPLTWSLGPLAPASMSVDAATGVLLWVPDYADTGSVSFDLSVADDDGGSDTQTITVIVGFLDADGDGLADTWESANGLDPTVDDAAADPDGDGLTNLAEFLAGSDPQGFNGPAIPLPLGPTDGAEVTSLSPLFVWAAATDPDGDPLTYDVEIWADAALAVLHDARTGLTVTEHVPDAPLPDNADAWWRVRAADPHVLGVWSDLERVFINLANDPPAPPTPLGPVDGASVDSLRPELRWLDGVDIDRDALSYDVQVLLDGAVIATATDLPGARETAWEVDVDLLEDTTYEWTVRAIDEHGLEGPWSAPTELFVSTSNGAPEGLEITSPADGAEVEDQSPDIVSTTATDPEGQPLTYTFEVDRAESFDSPDLRTSEWSDSAPDEVRWELASDGTLLDDNVMWHARARATDEGGASTPWSTVSFFVRGPNDPPEVPLLLSPDDGSILTAPLTLSVAHSVDPEGDPVRHEFVLATDQALTDVLEQALVEPGAGPAGTAEQTSWEATISLGEPGYWSARAVDDRGASSDWAAPRSLGVTGCGCSAGGAITPTEWVLLLFFLGLGFRLRRLPPRRERPGPLPDVS